MELKGDSADDTSEITFGLREVSAAGTQLAINGRKTFIRGTLECCIFPKTGHPPTDVAEWKRIIQMKTWKPVRVVISGTFRDIEVESDHPVRVVFPVMIAEAASR